MQVGEQQAGSSHNGEPGVRVGEQQAGGDRGEIWGSCGLEGLPDDLKPLCLSAMGFGGLVGRVLQAYQGQHLENKDLNKMR